MASLASIRVDVVGGQPDNSATALPDFDRWMVRDDLCGFG